MTADQTRGEATEIKIPPMEVWPGGAFLGHRNGLPDGKDVWSEARADCWNVFSWECFHHFLDIPISEYHALIEGELGGEHNEN